MCKCSLCNKEQLRVLYFNLKKGKKEIKNKFNLEEKKMKEKKIAK